MTEVFGSLSVFFNAILAGATALEVIVITPSLRRLAPRTAVDAATAYGVRGLMFAAGNGVSALVCAIVVLVAAHDFDEAATILTVVGSVVLLGGAAATILLYVPAFKALEKWTEGDHGLPIGRWARAQAVRTCLYSASLGCFIAAVVVR